MFGFFRKPKKVVEIPRDPPEGLYQGVWEKKRQPSPGAQAFAWETLSLAQFVPSGPSITVRQGFKPLPGTQQPYVGQAVNLDGVPIVAGQMVGQPLFDPNSGYVGSGLPIVNNPFPFSSEPAGGRAI